MTEKKLPKFSSFMERRELFAVLLYLPIHALILPRLLGNMYLAGQLSEAQAELIRYSIAFAYMLIVSFRFLRREFDPLCDDIFNCLLEVGFSYFAMLAFNFCVNSLILWLISDEMNPNNQALIELARTDFKYMKTMSIYLAPSVEELIFRAGIFGGIRRRNRAAAYIISALLFSVYHVWGYAMLDSSYWIFLLQYIPVSLLLARCYERTNSLWPPIFFHMLVNYMSLEAISALENML